jgi:hypothetical protein
MTLVVDYGTYEEKFKYCVPTHSGHREQHFAFCNENFIRKNWHYYHFSDAIYFKRKKDLMWFKLRFGI